MSIKIRGAQKLLKKLDYLEKKGARRALRKAVSAGTTVLKQGVREETPVDKGYLRKAQDSKVSGRGLSLSGKVGANVAKLNEESSQDAGRPTNIDHLVEFGHANTDGSFTPGSGYMRRAAAKSMPAAEARFTEKLAEEIEKEAMR